MTAGRMMTHSVGDACPGGHRDDHANTYAIRGATVNLTGQPLRWPAECCQHGARAEYDQFGRYVFIHGEHRKEVPLDEQIMFSGVSILAAVQRELDLFITACHEYDDGEDER